MTTSVVTDMNLGQNGAAKQSGRGGRRKSKGGELTQKKNRQPQRGMGVAQLEREIRLQERLKKMTEVPTLHPQLLPSYNPAVGFTASSCTAVPNVDVHFRPAHVASPTPAMLVQGIGIHGANLYSTDHIKDPSVIGWSNAGFRFENSKELSSIPKCMKCSSDGCVVCRKKKRINGGCNPCTVNPLRNFSRNNTFVEMIDAGKTRRSSGQVVEVTSAHGNCASSLTEYVFFPGKAGGAEELKELRRMGSTTTCSVAGALGFRGGEGSCVTAITGSEEGSVSSIDLSLKLSY